MPQQPSASNPSPQTPSKPSQNGVPSISGKSHSGNPTRGAQIASGDKATTPDPLPSKGPEAPTPKKG